MPELEEMLDEQVIPRLSLEGLNLMPSQSEKEYHNDIHAFSVARVAQRMLMEADRKTTRYEYSIIQVASYFHDTGHSNGPTDGHEERSCELFRGTCEQYRNQGYTISEQFEDDVCEAILGTIFLEKPNSYLAQILSDADVWNFGATWETFKNKTLAVRDEFAPDVSDEEWIGFRAQVLTEHTFYTDIGRSLFAGKKQENIDYIQEKYKIVTEKPWD